MTMKVRKAINCSFAKLVAADISEIVIVSSRAILHELWARK